MTPTDWRHLSVCRLDERDCVRCQSINTQAEDVKIRRMGRRQTELGLRVVKSP